MSDATATGAQRKRKQQVLTHGTASVVRSITDAVVVKNGEPFLVCPPNGDIPTDGRHGFGLYHHDTRFLSGYELRAAGMALTSLAANAADGTRGVVQLSNPELRVDGTRVPKERLDVRWTRTLEASPPALHDELRITNLGLDDVRVPFDLTLAADFRDVFAIRGLLDERPGTVNDPAWDGNGLCFAYDGADDVRRELRVTFDPPPDRKDGTTAGYDLSLSGRTSATLRLTLAVTERVAPGKPAVERGASPKRPTEAHGPATSIQEGRWIGTDGWRTHARTDSLVLDEVLSRSLDDLRLLRSRLDGRSYYEAGIPWFATLFGRDAIVTTLQTLAFDTDTAADTLRLLAARQGTKDDEWRDEEPGKILHELRIGELARLNEIPHTPYYGTIDATPLFLVLLARHAAWTGSLDLFRELRSNVDRALDWIDRTEDTYGGYVAYDSSTERGLVNQGWKDSGDGIVKADGHIADPPIALAEVQAYVHLARREIAGLFERDGDGDRARRLRDDADGLRERFERDFWSDQLGCYVLALGRDREPCAVVASNAGQVLWTGIADPAHADAVAARLMAGDMFNGWGIRTLSADARAYTPIGYHLGTVWPHDNGIIAAGFRRYGHGDEAERLFVALVEAALHFEHQRLPECFAGYPRDAFGEPVRYPVACHPQAWAAGSVPHLLESALGLEADGFGGRLRVVEPRLPPFVSEIELRGLTVGTGSAQLRFVRQDDGSTGVEVLGTDGGLDVETGAAAGVPVGSEPSGQGDRAEQVTGG